MKGKIYKLVCNKTNNVYYGSTTVSLMKRRDNHRQHYKRYLKGGGGSYLTSFDIIKDDDFIIELVEEIEFEDIKELRTRERYHIQNNICVNKVIPTRTDKEYYIDNKEHCNEMSRIDYQNNKEKYDALNKKWASDNRERSREIKKKYKSKIGIFNCLLCGGKCKDTTWDINRHNLTKLHLGSI